MADREKAIKGLECCLKTLNGNDGCPIECPYCEECLESIRTIFIPMMRDALALLKAQEPRVMTLDEVHEMSWDYCYLEEEVIKDKVSHQVYNMAKHSKLYSNVWR